MGNLRDVVAYLVKHYPHKSELSKARLTKIVYLADWRSAIVQGKQITNILWEFNHYGPYVDDVVDIAKNDPDFSLDRSINLFGSLKEVIKASSDISYDSLTEDEIEILDFVIRSTAPKYWNEFIKLVYSTYPIVTQSRFSKLDLVELAKNYKEENNRLARE
jgi:hypothetical protein